MINRFLDRTRPEAWIPILVLLLLFVGGCSTTSSRREEYYLNRLDLSESAQMTAYRAGNRLYLRLPRLGRDIYIRADWTETERSGEDYSYVVAELGLDAKASGELRARQGDYRQLSVLGPHEWSSLVKRLLESLTGDSPGDGVLLLLQNQEIVMFRDELGVVRVVPLEERPQNVSIRGKYNDLDFAREVMGVLEEHLGTAYDDRAELLFATATDPPFVLIDVAEQVTVFFNRSVDPDLHGAEPTLQFSFRTLNWLLLKSHLLAVVKNPCTFVGRGLATIRNTGVTLLNSGVADPQEPIPEVGEAPGMDLEAWEKELDGLVSSPRYKGRLDLLIDGEEFFPAFIQSIQDAKERIDVRVYIFDNDDYAVKIADLLKSRSREVKVRVLMDAMGSLFASANPPDSPMPADFREPGEIKGYLRRHSRVRVREALNPWFTADHVKTFSFDHREVYLGGMNIGRQYRHDWHDLMVRVEGPIVRRLERDFRRAWAHAGLLGDLAYLWAILLTPDSRTVKGAEPEMIDLRPLYTQTAKKDILRAQLRAIESARSYIYIENGYFTDDILLNALIQARQRGVDVRVILPGRNDLGIMDKSNMVTANTMLRCGIRVFDYPGMSHVKAAIYDGWACLGSANFDKLSLRMNQEIDIAFSDPEAVERLRRELFEVDFARSRELTELLPLSWMDYVVDGLANQL